uniref:EthD domain-containing protein n=1 Tax=Candidatus Kentrum sp. TUN TaxID=2126343 RepID=A0A450ZHV2_9GAMM|nr:MAG: EthD domain-containing protein [Candidatus Kentron sp. TUN]VFK55227.1 MAG: EthD domain-containing protein [Candidatus Kentron sp. TUN]
MSDIIHVFEFVSRAPPLSLADFSERWLTLNRELIDDDPTVRQCSVLTRFPQDDVAGPAAADGVLELWFESLEEYTRFQQRREADEKYRSKLAGILNGPPNPRLITRDHVIFSRWSLANDDKLIRLFYVIRRAEGLSLEHFSRYYRYVHTLYSEKPPFQRHYVQAHRLPAIGTGEPEFDGVSCIRFEDRAGLDGYLASEELVQGVADCERFLDLSRFFSVAGLEYRLRWAGLPIAIAGDHHD